MLALQNKPAYKIDSRASIIRTLAYFDLFDYPISKAEIALFLDQKIEDNELESELRGLTEDQRIFLLDEYYSLKDNRDRLKRRRDGYKHAQSLLVKAYRISAFLFQFPFVRGVGISGSLSKNCADADADIDFFIITCANRLWMARTFMHIFKKLTFLVGRQHWFCMNYYIDEQALEIGEKNVFTATELITLIPVCGSDVFKKFYYENEWTSGYFPNHPGDAACINRLISDSWLKKALEYLFGKGMWDFLENYFMHLTSRRWKKKEDMQKLNIKKNRMGLKTGKHYARPNPVHFQQKLLKRYDVRLNELEAEFDLSFSRK